MKKTASSFTLPVKLHSRAESSGDEKDGVPWNQPYISMTYNASNRASGLKPRTYLPDSSYANEWKTSQYNCSHIYRKITCLLSQFKNSHHDENCA